MADPTIVRIEALDVRFPTSRTLAGSDAMNLDPDYSAAYVILHTDRHDPDGHGLAFTIGRGNELCVAAIETLGRHLVGRSLDELTGDMVGTYRKLAHDTQMRWLGPEKGVVQLATAALLNAVWDLWAKTEGKPLWKLLADMPAEQIVACVDFRYLSDALRPDEAVALLELRAAGKDSRQQLLLAEGFPAYTTSPGWLGYDDDTVRRLCREAVAAGWQHIKMKVGSDGAENVRRAALIRQEIGPRRKLMMDANQVWDVDEAIERSAELKPFEPYWIEEPTSPDDILGHAAIREALAPTRVATGEHCHNRVMFKQFMAAGAIDVCQLDACRLGGVNEVLAVLLLAAKYDVPVCPHAGGVGLCEYVQHLAMFDFLRVGASLEGRLVEYVDHLHDHFVDPVRMRGGRYLAPMRPGYSIEMRPQSLRTYAYPNGEAWQEAP